MASNQISTLLSTSRPDLAAPNANPSKSKRDTPEAIAKTAKEFESLLIGEVLKSAREADGSGFLGTDESEAGSTLMELSEQQLSQALSSGGGLGLAKLISAGLTKTAAQTKKISTPGGDSL
jgi:Rod binding domain-containing protein